MKHHELTTFCLIPYQLGIDGSILGKGGREDGVETILPQLLLKTILTDC